MEKQARRALGESGRRHSAHIASDVVSGKRAIVHSRSTVRSPPMASKATCRSQYTWALSSDQTARPT
eukprot:6111444-Pleurochrysis_carterae.AAC.1